LLGKRVHELRAAKKWSQEEFAAVAGLHRTYIGQNERSEKNLSCNLIKISGVLGVTPSGLLSVLDGEGTPASKPIGKQDIAHPKAIDSARRIHDVQKLLKQLRHQRKAMDQAMESLEILLAAPTPTISSRRTRPVNRNSGGA